jgi:hypothetical protein
MLMMVLKGNAANFTIGIEMLTKPNDTLLEKLLPRLEEIKKITHKKLKNTVSILLKIKSKLCLKL